jgi:hypothetical protein
MPTYRGKDLVRGYSRWFGTDRLCAILELRLLGVSIPEARLVDAQRLARQGVTPRPRPSTTTRHCLDVLDLIAGDPIAMWQMEEYEALDRYYNPDGRDDQQTGRLLSVDEGSSSAAMITPTTVSAAHAISPAMEDTMTYPAGHPQSFANQHPEALEHPARSTSQAVAGDPPLGASGRAAGTISQVAHTIRSEQSPTHEPP